MDWKTTLTLVTTVVLAASGYVVKYRQDLIMARRKDRLDRINLQLRELYGPLLAITTATSGSWSAFRNRYRPTGPFWGAQSPPSDEEAAAYRLWMREVFMPLNSRMAEIVTTHAHLIEGNEFPPCLRDLCAHVASHHVLTVRWAEGDFTEHTLGLNFPRQVEDYVSTVFQLLKRAQTDLLALESAKTVRRFRLPLPRLTPT